jgi:hypothetical protein
MNPNAKPFLPKRVAPLQVFANKLSDLPEGTPKVSTLGLKTRDIEYWCNSNGQLVPRPIPISFKFNLFTESWDYEERP